MSTLEKRQEYKKCEIILFLALDTLMLGVSLVLLLGTLHICQGQVKVHRAPLWNKLSKCIIVQYIMGYFCSAKNESILQLHATSTVGIFMISGS